MSTPTRSRLLDGLLGFEDALTRAGLVPHCDDGLFKSMRVTTPNIPAFKLVFKRDAGGVASAIESGMSTGVFFLLISVTFIVIGIGLIILDVAYFRVGWSRAVGILPVSLFVAGLVLLVPTLMAARFSRKVEVNGKSIRVTSYQGTEVTCSSDYLLSEVDVIRCRMLMWSFGGNVLEGTGIILVASDQAVVLAMLGRERKVDEYCIGLARETGLTARVTRLTVWAPSTYIPFVLG